MRLMPTSDKTSETGWLGSAYELSNRAKKLATMIGLQARAKICRKSGAGGAFGAGNDASVNPSQTVAIDIITTSPIVTNRCSNGLVTATASCAPLNTRHQSGCQIHCRTAISPIKAYKTTAASPFMQRLVCWWKPKTQSSITQAYCRSDSPARSR